MLNVIAKEVLLSDRLSGFKHWRHTADAQQTIDMIAAFGDKLDMEWLGPRLEREGTVDAFVALRELAESSELVTEERLQRLLERLTGR